MHTGPIVQVSCDPDDPKSVDDARRAAAAVSGALGIPTTVIGTPEMTKRGSELLAAWSAATPSTYEANTGPEARQRNAQLALAEAMAAAAAAVRLLLELTTAADALNIGSKSMMELASRASRFMGEGDALCPLVATMRDACDPSRGTDAPTAPGGDA